MDLPKIIILSEPLRGEVIELTQDVYTIGQSEDNDIVLSESTVSRHHAKLLKDKSGSYHLSDLDSTNKSRVNGVVVSSQELKNSDIISCGEIEILFSFDQRSNFKRLMDKVFPSYIEVYIDPDSIDKRLLNIDKYKDPK